MHVFGSWKVAISIDYLVSAPVIRIIIPQADLTLIDAGPPALYEFDTDTFFTEVKALEASAVGIAYQNAIDHNPAYTVAGETYARKIEVMNSTNNNPVLGGPNTEEYEVFFDPDTQYSVKLTGSNNNLFDLQNGILANNTTQVIPTNSGGLIHGALTAADVAQIFNFDLEDGETFAQTMRLIRAAAAGDVVQQPDGSYVIKSKDGLTDRITGDDAANSGRTISATDGA